MSLTKKLLTIAVDFDGTIVEDAYPKIGKPHSSLVVMRNYFYLVTDEKSRPENHFASSSLTVDAFSDFDFSRCFCFPHAINLGKTNGKKCDKVATEMRKYHTATLLLVISSLS